MDIKKYLAISRWLLLTGLLSWGAIMGFAQSKAGSKAAQPPIPAQSKTKWIKDPNSVMPMRQMTNTQRRAAAARNAARRHAAAQKRPNVPANPGVQQ
jgi:hypothetical protein